MLLGALALLLVVAVLGTTFLIIPHLRAQGSPSTSTARSTKATATATVLPTLTAARPTPTTPPRDTKANGWTAFTPAVWGGDVKFAQSNPQHGYLCGQGPNDRVVAVTTDGGQHWQVASSPAQYSNCSLQVSTANPLDVVVNSQVSSGQAISVDAHFSTDGGMTWKAAPIPPDTQIPGGAAWSSSYLYVWAGTSRFGPQPNSLQVSANGGPFTSVDPNRLVPGAQNIAIQSAIGTSDHLYLNLGYTGCSAQTCQAIVASGDGGQHWTQLPNQSSIQLMAVAANTLYGQAPDPQVPQTFAEWTSSDSGATWTRLTLPPLPGGLHVPLCWPAPDGALVGTQGAYVAYLHGGVWTILPFSSVTTAEDLHVEVTLDAGGKPNAVWAINDGNNSDAGVYWHALS